MPDGETSPYSAHSSFAIDPIYMDLRDIVGDSFCDTREETAANVHVDYAKVRAQKRAAIALAYQRFLGHPRHRAILDTFVEEQRSWLEPFARFEVFCGRYGLDWQSWPKETTPSRLEARPDAQRWSTPIDPSIDRIYFEQWVLHTQWTQVRRALSKIGVQLMGDLPFVVGKNSADVWANPNDFYLDRSLGVPADALSDDGQTVI